MKILHITNNYPTSRFPIFGIFVKEQIESLSNQGLENDVFFINGRENGKYEYIKAVTELKEQLKKSEYDIIHCHHVFSAIVFILTGFHKRIKSVVSFQNDPTYESKFNLLYFVKKRFDTWIFKNNSVHADGIKGFYFPNGVNTTIFRPIDQDDAKLRLGLRNEKKYILFVSSNFIRPQKNYALYKQTLAILKSTDPLVEELQMINVKRELVPYYFNASSLHLLTSEFEGSPNSVKESMACNTPVVSTNVGNVSDLFQKVDGCHISDKDPEKLALCCQKVLEEKYTNARDEIIRKKLDIDSVAIKLKNLYIRTLKH